MVKITKEQLEIAKKNGISRSTVYAREKDGWTVEKAITEKTSRKFESSAKKGGRIFAGRLVTNEQLKIAEQNEINDTTLWNRINKGMDIEQAIREPSRKTKPSARHDKVTFDKSDVIEIIGRIKMLNKHHTSDFPIPVPKPIIDKMKQFGLQYDAIPMHSLNEVS